jgi:hypothetical protein
MLVCVGGAGTVPDEAWNSRMDVDHDINRVRPCTLGLGRTWVKVWLVRCHSVVSNTGLEVPPPRQKYSGAACSGTWCGVGIKKKTQTKNVRPHL